MEELFEKVGDNYLVSNNGVVINIKRDIVMKTRFDKQGYEVLVLQLNGRPTNCSIHRLVATCFLDNPYNLPQVNHIDGVKSNNIVSNLEWVTPSQNNQHAYDLSLRKQGEEHHKAKLNASDVNEIRDRLANGESHRYIASCYAVGRTTISKIAAGQIWKHS